MKGKGAAIGGKCPLCHHLPDMAQLSRAENSVTKLNESYQVAKRKERRARDSTTSIDKTEKIQLPKIVQFVSNNLFVCSQQVHPPSQVRLFIFGQIVCINDCQLSLRTGRSWPRSKTHTHKPVSEPLDWTSDARVAVFKNRNGKPTSKRRERARD